MVYQGLLRGGDEDGIFWVNKFATKDIKPDILFLVGFEV